MKYLLALFLTVFSLASGEEYYVSGYVGPNLVRYQGFKKNDFKTGYRACLATGFYFMPYWKIEIEGNYRRNTLKSQKNYLGVTWKPQVTLEATSAFINLYNDFIYNNGNVSYIGLGIGRSYTRTKLRKEGHFSWRETHWSAQAILGIRKILSQNLSFGFEYRFIKDKQDNFEQSFGPILTLIY